MELKNPYPKTHRFVKVEGTPYEMGRQRVQKLREIVKPYIDNFLPVVKREIEERNLQAVIDRFQNAMEAQAPELLEEMRGIADEAEVKFADIVAMNFIGEVPAPDWKTHGTRRSDSPYREESCTAFGAVGPATADKMPVVGKTYGCPIISEEVRNVRLLIWKIPKDGIPHFQDSLPAGPFGEDGMNDNGLVLNGCGVLSFDGVEAFDMGKPVGLPINFMNHVIMEHCSSIDEAVEYLKRTPKGYTGRNQLVVQGDAIIRVETSYDEYNIIWPDVDAHHLGNYVMAAANHFPSKKMNHLSFDRTPKGYISSYFRYDRAKEILLTNTGRVDFELSKMIARDHVNGPSANSICRHGRVFTGGSLICQPALKRVWYLSGNPCENVWTPYTLER